MRLGLLILLSLLLIISSIVLALVSIRSSYFEVVNFSYGSVAVPPPYQSYYWAVLTHGEPKAEIYFNSTIINLPSIENYSLPYPSHYVYVVYGYVQPYAYLSILSLFLASVGSLIGFKASILYFQSLKIGDLVKGYAVGGSMRKYVLKRFFSSIFSLFLVFLVVSILEFLHGNNVFSSLLSFLTFNGGISSYFGISVSSLILTSLSYTSLLLSLTFVSTIYLTSFLSIYGLTNKLIGKILYYWKYVGSALASWVLALIVLYVFHYFLHLFSLSNIVMPFISLFFPYVGIYANRLLKDSYKRNIQSMKGLDDNIIIYRHVLGNVSVLMLSSISSAFMEMLVAELLVEGIFNWPGFGELLRIAVFNGDYKVVEGVMLTFSTIEIISSFITDIVYGLIDPRVTR
ncbi:ABC transporter permease [Acidianus sulfidivorans]|uniref:ABC transporter permease subunit n=1 Tax=Acidianus sulfidivorans TaxID=312539 RepID=UPI0013A5BD9F|nr:ABC transporter permease [Acidianus sulfidivorans]